MGEPQWLELKHISFQFLNQFQKRIKPEMEQYQVHSANSLGRGWDVKLLNSGK